MGIILSTLYHHLSNQVSHFKSTGVIVHDSPVFYQNVITCNPSDMIIRNHSDFSTTSLYSSAECTLFTVQSIPNGVLPHSPRILLHYTITEVKWVSYWLEFFPNVFPVSFFSGNMQSCFTVLTKPYIFSDNYRPFSVFMSPRDDATVNHSDKYCH